MKKLIIDSKKPIYDKIVFEIDGVEYSVNYPLTVREMIVADKWEEKAKEGNIEALVEQLCILSNVPKEVALDIDVWSLTQILGHVQSRLLVPAEDEEEKGKNSESSGETASA